MPPRARISGIYILRCSPRGDTPIRSLQIRIQSRFEAIALRGGTPQFHLCRLGIIAARGRRTAGNAQFNFRGYGRGHRSGLPVLRRMRPPFFWRGELTIPKVLYCLNFLFFAVRSPSPTLERHTAERPLFYTFKTAASFRRTANNIYNRKVKISAVRPNVRHIHSEPHDCGENVHFNPCEYGRGHRSRPLALR